MQGSKKFKRITKRFRTMKEDQFDKDIMDYIDGVSSEVTNKDAYEQAKHLKQIVISLKEIPLQSVSRIADDRFYQFIAEKSTNVRSVLTLKQWLPFVMAAASIIILFVVLNNYKGFEDDYRALSSNPEKLSFIYNLNEQQLRTKDIDWLTAELKNEISPNIKVTIVDLLANYQSKLDNEFYNSLQSESIPSVQMALLNSLESSENIDFSNELLVFNQRKDLDKTVRQKVKNILSNQ